MKTHRYRDYESTWETPRIDNETEGDSETASVHQTQHGISAVTAAIFIVGEMAGSGVLALPRAIVDAGWIGLVLVIILCLNACYGGTRLALCWEIVEERYPECRGATPDPYATIASKAVGRWGRILVSASIQITLFGAGVVYLLLAAQSFRDLLKSYVTMSHCIWFLIIAAFITVPMWLGSPKDFWFVGVGAVITTVIACIFIFIQTIIDGSHDPRSVPHQSKTFKDFFLSFGTILFSFGGASTFPTIQNDMIDRTKFRTSVYGGFAVILMLYLPVSYSGYFVYGDRINANIILSLSSGFCVVATNISMALHLIMAFLIVINPVCQEVENLCCTVPRFGMSRILIRTSMVLLMVFIGESIPQFSKILSLVGGSTITLLTFILPNVFYMKLCDQESTSWPKRTIPLYSRIYMWELILLGAIGGAAATYSAFDAIFNTALSKPCYIP